MESASNTALLIAILAVFLILIILFFIRLRQLKKASEEGETEFGNVPDSRGSTESASNSLHSPAEILDARVIIIKRERASILLESPRQQITAGQTRTDSTPNRSPQPARASQHSTNVSTRSEIETIERSPRQSRTNWPVSTIHHAPPLSPKYPDSVYTATTLPSYPETTQSQSPPAYSDLSRAQSRVTLSEISQRMTYGENAFDAMPDLARLEEGRRWA